MRNNNAKNIHKDKIIEFRRKLIFGTNCLKQNRLYKVYQNKRNIDKEEKISKGNVQWDAL